MGQPPIQAVHLSRTQVFNMPYASSFSQVKRLDTLLVPYTVPTVASNTGIKLKYEIVNQNALKLTRIAWIWVL